MLVCLFIVVWLLRAFKLLRFPSFSCKNADFYTKNGRVNFGGFSGLPEQNYEVFFLFIMAIWAFLTTFTHQLHSGCLILANEIAANIKSTSRLKFKSTSLECHSKLIPLHELVSLDIEHRAIRIFGWNISDWVAFAHTRTYLRTGEHEPWEVQTLEKLSEGNTGDQ